MENGYPIAVDQLFSAFKAKGKQLYIVGGAVRDHLLGLEPTDYDFATDATPEEVQHFFDKTFPTGLPYGTVTVIIDNTAFEVTTYRSDVDSDGRRPKAVQYSQHLEDDLSRRDFTINAMAMNAEGAITDLFGGREDLQKGLVRFVGDPEQRIREDKLRLIRGIRLCARFGFTLDPLAYEQVFRGADRWDLSQVSVERFQSEFDKILLAPHVAKGLALLEETRLLDAFLTEFRGILEDASGAQKWTRAIRAVSEAPLEIGYRLAALLYPLMREGDERWLMPVEALLKRLRYSAQLQAMVLKTLAVPLPIAWPASDRALRCWLKIAGAEALKPLLLLSSALDELESTTLEIKYKALPDAFQIILASGAVLERSQLAIDGKTLMEELGLRGRQVGEMLETLAEICLFEPERNEKRQLIELARKKAGGEL